MAFVSDFSHSESIVLLKTLLTDSVHGKSLFVELLQQRHLATCIIRSPLLHHHDRSLLLCHCIRRNLLHLLSGTHGVFLSDLFRVRHDNAFPCPPPRRCCTCLSHFVSDSDVCASVSVSLFKILSSDFKLEFLVACLLDRSLCRQVSPRSRSAFPPSTLAVLPAPAHCSLLGGATSTRHDAISGKRLTVRVILSFCVSV